MPLSHIMTLRKRADFVRAKTGRKYRSAHIHLQCIASPERSDDMIRVGYTVSKHCGNAVIRNKIKRRLRQVMRDLLPNLGRAGHDYVVIAREGADAVPFDLLRDTMTHMLKKAHSQTDTRHAGHTGQASAKRRTISNAREVSRES